jgi:hypothetical protein
MVNQSHKPKSFLRALLLLALILSGVAQSHAKDFSYGGLTYTTLSDNTCETKAGSSSSAGNSVSGDLVIPETVYDSNEHAYTVTALGDDSFYYCGELTSITIPNSVTKIGSSAFSKCTGLTSVTIPNSVTKIGLYAFSGCTELTSVTIPNSVTEIWRDAFYGCSGLTKVNISDLAAWCNITFGNYASNPLSYAQRLYLDDQEITELNIPNSVTSIGEYAFYGCNELTSVTIPNSVTSIGGAAFEGCTGLTSVTIPNSVTEIGSSAFSGCAGLTSVTIPNSVTKIGSYAFSGCTELTSVTIPNSVTEIGSYAFSGCTGLTSVTIPNSVTKIEYAAFAKCTGLTSVTIPNSVTKIEYSAFVLCTGLTSVTIPNSVTSIGGAAFEGCTGLTSVTIPNSVTEIGSSAFRECTGLTSVTIPNSVTKIGEYAFEKCTGLKQIISLAITPPTIYSYTFSDYSVPLIVPSEDYKTADYWKKFTDITVSSDISTGTTFEVDGLKYEVISDEDCTCRLYAIDESVSGDVVIPETVSYDGKEFTPVEIPVTLIEGETSITSLTIPSNITTIGSAVAQDTSLAKLTVNTSVAGDLITGTSVDELVIGASVKEFSNDLNSNTIGKLTIKDGMDYLTISALQCAGPTKAYLGRNLSSAIFANNTNLAELTIGSGVTTIKDYAFSGCSGLTSVTIGPNVRWIGISAFSGCTGLTSIVTPNSLMAIGNEAFANCSGLTSITIGSSVENIGVAAFYGCTGLTSVDIPNSVTVIWDSAFKECAGLTSVTFGNSLTTISDEAFEYCTGLTSVVIPNSVTEIGKSVFSGCTGLRSVTIPGSVQTIGDDAFSGCSHCNVYIEDVAAWCGISFGNAQANPLYNVAYLYLNNDLVKELTIPASVKKIGNYAFCTSNSPLFITLLKFEEAESGLEIGTNALKSIYAEEIFFGRQMDFTRVPCSKLETVEFGENVKSMADGAFSSAASLRSVTAHSDVPPTIGDATFASDTYTTGTLYVKNDAISSYKAADGWKNFCNVAAYDITDGINEVGNDNNTVNGTQVSVANGAICIAGDADVRIVSMNGTTIYNGRGNISVNVAPGIYVVLANGTATKVAVK